jgi:hypothetical protein
MGTGLWPVWITSAPVEVVVAATPDDPWLRIEGAGMYAHPDELSQLAEELFDEVELVRMRQAAQTQPLDVAQVLAFDASLGGPSMIAIEKCGHGRYTMADREIFRPLQYCSMHFEGIYVGDRPEWQARNIVMYSSLHIEGLVKRIGDFLSLPLGMALRRPIAKSRIDPVVWEKLDRYTRVYNASKHDFTQEKDTHLFSLKDAVLAYFVCRRLGCKLYPIAALSTDLALLEREAVDTQALLREWEPWRLTVSQRKDEDSYLQQQ